MSILGEFWAMTTEGDGNYHLQRFLEQEGAEVDIESNPWPLAAWILFMVWENRHDTRERMMLRGEGGGRKGLQGKDPWKKLLTLWVAEVAIRAMFGTLALVAGLRRYPLPDMEPHG